LSVLLPVANLQHKLHNIGIHMLVRKCRCHSSSAHISNTWRMHASLMTCTFGYVFLLSSAHKRRKLSTNACEVVRLVQPELPEGFSKWCRQKPRASFHSRLFKFRNITIQLPLNSVSRPLYILLIPDADSWSGAIIAMALISLVVKYIQSQSHLKFSDVLNGDIRILDNIDSYHTDLMAILYKPKHNFDSENKFHFYS